MDERAQANLMENRNKRDFVVNGAFSFEITDYFRFEDKYIKI